MRRRLTTLFVLSTAVVSVLLLGVHGGSPWPDAITLISDHGVRGGIASDRTRQALRELVYPRGIPDGASHYFVSSEEGGWFPRGAIKAAGTPLDPLRDFVAVQEIIDHGAGPLFFEFDPADNFEHNPANGKGFFRQPDHTGGCGDTGVVCWTFASADRTGVQTPTFSCSDHSVIPVGDGFFENDTDDALALVNIRIRCPATPDEDLKPVFYAEGLLYLLNVVVDGIVGSGNTFFKGVAGAATFSVGLSGTTQDGHAFDGMCVGADDPYECCTATPDCDGSDPLFFDVSGGDHVFVGGSFLYRQSADSANVPRISFGDFGAGDTRFYGTRFRYLNDPADQDTLKYGLYLSDTATVAHTHGAITNDFNNDSNDDATFYFEANDANQAVDLRLYRATHNGMERNLNAPDLIDSAANTVWGRCLNWDEPDVSKDQTCYDVYMDDVSGDGSLAGTELTLDIQNSIFDDECGTVQFFYDGTSDDEISDFRTTATDSITSYFGAATHSTVGGEGSLDCGGAGNSFCVPDGYRQTAVCGGSSIADCYETCSTPLLETLPGTFPDFFLGTGGAFSTWSFNPNGDQHIGGGN